MFFILWRFIRRFWNRVPAGTIFALYVALYSLGRLYIETLRIDTADVFFGQRLNVWVALICLIAGALAFLLLFRKRLSKAPEPAKAVTRSRRPGTSPRRGPRPRSPPVNAPSAARNVT